MTWLFEAAAASELSFIVCCLGIYNSSEGPKSKWTLPESGRQTIILALQDFKNMISATKHLQII